MADGTIFSKIIHETDTFQIRVEVTEFRDSEWIHIRKFYLDFEEEWHPTKEGISLPLTLDNTIALLTALASIVSTAEDSNIKQQIIERLNEQRVP